MEYRYYLTERGPGPGAIPRNADNLIVGVVDYGKKVYVCGGECMAWGHIEYQHPLQQKDIDDYELKEDLYNEA